MLKTQKYTIKPDDLLKHGIPNAGDIVRQRFIKYLEDLAAESLNDNQQIRITFEVVQEKCPQVKQQS